MGIMMISILVPISIKYFINIRFIPQVNCFINFFLQFVWIKHDFFEAKSLLQFSMHYEQTNL